MSTFVLKWNPEISSFKYASYLHILTDPYDMGLNWSIHDWRKMKSGDRVFFLRVGERPQLLASGYITSEPYRDSDWSGRGREVYYADLFFDVACHPDYEHVLTAETLEKELSDFDWRAGHSGVLLTEDKAETLELLWTGFLYDHQDDFSREYLFDDKEDEFGLDEPDDLTAGENEDGEEPFVGIIGLDGDTFDMAYGTSDAANRNSVLQRILTRRFGNDCGLCGYNYQRLFGATAGFCNPYLYISELKCADWVKSFVCVCPSCEKVLTDDQSRFLEALKGREKRK